MNDVKNVQYGQWSVSGLNWQLNGELEFSAISK